MFVIISVFYYRGCGGGIQPERSNARAERVAHHTLPQKHRSKFEKLGIELEVFKNIKGDTPLK